MHMRKGWIAAGMLFLAGSMTLTIVAAARSQAPAAQTLKGQIATAAKLKDADVEKMLKELGPAIARRISRGEKVEIVGLGTFRVVNVPEHPDLVQGRVTTIPSTNYVEFLPAAEVARAAASPNAVPAEIVPPFQFNPLPNQTPGPRVPTIRTPSTRVP